MQDLDLGELMRLVDLHEEWIRSNDQRGARLSLQNVSINGARIEKRTLARATFVDVRWTNCSLAGANVGSSSLQRVQFHSCDLSEAMLDGCNITALALNRCNARGLDFDSSSIYDLNIEGGHPADINFLRALLVRGKLAGLNLSNSRLRRAVVEDTDFRGSNLANANVSRASLKRTDLRDCALDGCVWERTWLDTVKMSGARGIPAEFTAIRTANVSITGAPDERLLQPGDEAQLEAFLRRTSST